jgi:putative flippase GtrA
MIISDKKERTRFIRFATVGIIGAVIDFGILNLLNQAFHIEILIAQAISFSTAVISNFTWNRLWTFPESRSKTMGTQLAQFAIVSVIGLGLRTLIFSSLDSAMISLSQKIFPSNFLLKPEVIGHNVSLAVVIIIILFWNFFINRFWTYNDVS